MKTWKASLISGAVCLALGAGAGVLTMWQCNKLRTPYIVAGPMKYTKVVEKENCAGLWACYNSPLMIDVIPKGNKYLVKAYDICKRRESYFAPEYKPRRNIIIIGGIFQTDLKAVSYGGYFDYYRLLNSFLGIGGGIQGLNNGFGLRAGLIFNF